MGNPLYKKIHAPVLNISSSDITLNIAKLKWEIFSAEVVDIILDSNHPNYESESSIGTIAFQDTRRGKKIQSAQNNYAKPISAYIKQYPIIHEIVAIIVAYNESADITTNSLSYYYTDIVNVWGMTNHNALPNSGFLEIDNTSTSPVSSPYSPKSTKKDFGRTFVEKNDVPILKPNEGDVILLGRWGQSIRFGRTISKQENTWSNKGNNGDPIIILQSSKSSLNDIKIEDINNDDSSVYIASNQTIGIEYSSESKDSYKISGNIPENSKSYISSQIVLSSNRITLNSKKDHMILSSNNSVWLTSRKSVNIDTSTFIANAKKYQFGVNATEPAVLGNQIVTLLTDLVNAILSDTRTVTTSGGPGNTVGPPLNIAQYNTILSRLSTIISKKMIIE